MAVAKGAFFEWPAGMGAVGTEGSHRVAVAYKQDLLAVNLDACCVLCG